MKHSPILLLPVLGNLLFAQAADGPETGFVPLFNGKDLAGWHIENGGAFAVKDGAIHVEEGKGWLRSDRAYRDFELQMEFRFVKGTGNSAILFRAAGNASYQVQTTSAIGPQGLGSIRSSKEENLKAACDTDAVRKARKPGTAWNCYTIHVQGRRAEVKLNGLSVATAENLAEGAGYLGIQGEGTPVEFRNIRIKDLTASGK